MNLRSPTGHTEPIHVTDGAWNWDMIQEKALMAFHRLTRRLNIEPGPREITIEVPRSSPVLQTVPIESARHRIAAMGFSVRFLTWRDERRSKLLQVDARQFEYFLRLKWVDRMMVPVLDLPPDCEFDGPYANYAHRTLDYIVSHGSFDVAKDGEEVPRLWTETRLVKIRIEDAGFMGIK